MPSTSKAQQKLFGMVHQYNKTGELPKKPSIAKAVQKLSTSMKKKDVKDFASTKHDDLPEKVKKVKEVLTPLIKEVIEEVNKGYRVISNKDREEQDFLFKQYQVDHKALEKAMERARKLKSASVYSLDDDLEVDERVFSIHNGVVQESEGSIPKPYIKQIEGLYYVYVYSPVVKRHVAMSEWGDKGSAEYDLRNNWMSTWKELSNRLKQK